MVTANIWEMQVADQAVQSLLGRRRQAQLLQRLLLVVVEGVCRVLPVCLTRLTHRIVGGGGFCFDISFLSCLRIKLRRAIRGQGYTGTTLKWLVGWRDEVSERAAALQEESATKGHCSILPEQVIKINYSWGGRDAAGGEEGWTGNVKMKD